MRVVNHSAIASTSRESAFAYLDNFRNVPLESVVHVTEWVHNERLTLESFEDAGDGLTRLVVVFRYGLPVGIAGKVLGAVVEPVVVQAIRYTEPTLRSRLEAAEA